LETLGCQDGSYGRFEELKFRIRLRSSFERQYARENKGGDSRNQTHDGFWFSSG